jgi:hypothetical protein
MTLTTKGIPSATDRIWNNIVIYVFDSPILEHLPVQKRLERIKAGTIIILIFLTI